MQPGRELDVLVAEKVMGDVNEDGSWYSADGSRFTHRDGGPRPYSIDWGDAGRVVEKIKSTSPHTWHIEYDPESNQWTAGFVSYFPMEWQEYSEASTAPYAICLAALRAVGVEVPADA